MENRTSNSASQRIVLVADDDGAIRNLIGTLLTQEGYTVLMARDGGEALALSASHRGVIDLFVSDVEMPNTTGPAAYNEIVTTRPDMKVLFISGRAPATVQLPTDSAFLSKPFKVAVLKARVREILEGPARN